MNGFYDKVEQIAYERGVEHAERSIRERLALSAAGPGVDADADLDHLIWQFGEYRRQIDAAHSKLDTIGLPKAQDDSRLTLAGRLQAAIDQGRIS